MTKLRLRLNYPLLQHNPNHTQRRPPQRIWVLAPGRLLVNRPEPHQRVQLVRQRHGDGHRVGRHAVGGALGFPMVLDGGGDGRVLALQGGVFAADQALKLGELADHFGLQVGFAEDGGAAGFGPASAPTMR